MNFDFSEDVEAMRVAVRGLLADRFPRGAVRRQVDAGQGFDRDFLRSLGEMGWLGVAIPEAFGGSAMGYEPLCMIAEELGASLAPVPVASTLYLGAEALLSFGSEEQKRALLPRVVAGDLVIAAAVAEGSGDPAEAALATLFVDGRVTGKKLPVIDGDIADMFVVVVRLEGGESSLVLVEAGADHISRTTLDTLDLVRGAVRLTLDGAVAEPLPGARGWQAVAHWLDRAAALLAFEQVGGAQAALDMATAFARERYAFGRAIGSFQAIKHKLADVYVATELARSNAFYGAWALDTDADDLAIAAAAARVAATDAFSLAARENIQTHGGMGFTWESDCHLYYRRARELALMVGGPRYWRRRLVSQLDMAAGG